MVASRGLSPLQRVEAFLPAKRSSNGSIRVSDVPILVCDCGKRLRAPGARPGRTGRCPACGSPLRFPSDIDLEPAPAAPEPEIAPSAKPKRKKRRGPETEIWNGLIKPPAQPESRLRESLRYPFWGATGVALLVIFPPILWLVTIVVMVLGSALVLGSGLVKIVSLISMIPAGLGLLGAGGFLLLYLAKVLASSAIGEMHHPKWPDWEISALTFGLGRWLVAFFVGGVVGGVPAIAFWIYCGDIGFFDAIILAELIAVGAIYALMALLASILHDDIWGANPITVLRAIRIVGWGYAEPCLVSGIAVVLACTVLGLAVELESPFLSAIFFYLFWVFALYEAMVVLRVLGLFYRKHARALGWFRGRTGWSS